jgi:cation transport regulator ChaC
MLLDTSALNQQRQRVGDDESVWLFGYGSLIWKADFPFIERRRAFIRGWERRFWQGSHDHRGTPEAPGRVATLIASPGAVCHGMAYRITGETLKPLDIREKNGYLREVTTLTFSGGEHAKGLVYLATEENPAYLGDAPLDAIAAQIDRAHGPSGANREYLLNLACALRELNVDDPHIFALADRVTAPRP